MRSIFCVLWDTGRSAWSLPAVLATYKFWILREPPTMLSRCGQRVLIDLRLAVTVQSGFLGTKPTRKFVDVVQDHIEFSGHISGARG